MQRGAPRWQLRCRARPPNRECRGGTSMAHHPFTMLPKCKSPARSSAKTEAQGASPCGSTNFLSISIPPWRRPVTHFFRKEDHAGAAPAGGSTLELARNSMAEHPPLTRMVDGAAPTSISERRLHSRRNGNSIRGGQFHILIRKPRRPSMPSPVGSRTDLPMRRLWSIPTGFRHLFVCLMTCSSMSRKPVSQTGKPGASPGRVASVVPLQALK